MFGHLPLPDCLAFPDLLSEPDLLSAPSSVSVAAISGLPLASATSPTWWIIGVTFALAACGLTYGYLHRPKKRAAKSAPSQPSRTPDRPPFDELAEAHKLDATEVALLQQAVQHLDLKQPLLLFIDPSLLRIFGSSNPAAEPLRQKLFGVPEQAIGPETASSDQSSSHLPSAALRTGQTTAERSSSIDAVAEDLLGDLPAADAPGSVDVEQPVSAEAVS